MSDREKAGLRGLVMSCAELSTFAGATSGDGTQIPPQTCSSTTEYDINGNALVSHGSSGTNGFEWEMQNSYDASGHIIKSVWKSSVETNTAVFSYDDQGRLISLANSTRPDNPITFHYDEHGRKTSVQTSRPADYRPNGAVAGSPFEALDTPPNLPGGGSAITIYDEFDRPVEVQVRNAHGEVVKRAARTYDSQGRVSEEHQILDNLEAAIPADFQAEIVKASGASAEEVRQELGQQLAKLFGGQASPYSIAYTYDAQGRLTQTRQRIFNEEHIIETTYNKHGDKALEIRRSKQVVGNNEQRPGLPEYSEVRYSYKYDDQGNWTVETISYRSSPDGAFGSSPGRQRSLIYY